MSGYLNDGQAEVINKLIPLNYKDYFNHRVDLNLGLNGSYKVGPILLRGKILYNKKFNYGRYDLGRNFAPDDNFAENDLVNWNFSLSARYLF
jgi:hypothetical protein